MGQSLQLGTALFQGGYSDGFRFFGGHHDK